MRRAIRRVIKNKGAPGVDGMTVKEINKYYKQHRDKIEKALLEGTYMPMPVRQKEIPKPDGGVRLLGIPYSTGQGNPASSGPGSYVDMGPYLFGDELWIPA